MRSPSTAGACVLAAQEVPLDSAAVDFDTLPTVRNAFGFQNIVGESPPLRAAVALAQRVAAARRASVLLVGESGTGKELFARAIHYAGTSVDEPFVAINCAAIPEHLLESELFGHERGAFPEAHARKLGLMELAGSGTLFLDEIDHLPRQIQPKLLSALESRHVSRLGSDTDFPIACRIVAAASPLLERVVANGAFGEDLYYRLNVFGIALPPLRERLDDVEALARHFLDEEAREHHRAKTFSDEAAAVLRVHRWPGNVRELKNVVERAVILSADSPTISAEHLMIQRRASRSATDDVAGEIPIPRQGRLLDDIERDAVAITLRITGGNQAAAARLLGISRPTLAKKMHRSNSTSSISVRS